MSSIIAGVDSSTQSVKVLLCDADSGDVLKSISRPHPTGTEVNPELWLEALQSALDEARGFGEIRALSISGQQHGMVALDADGQIIRPALLWNDTRSSTQADALNSEFPNIAALTGSKLVASFTASKMRWMAENEPENAKRVATICLPHDWLSWKLTGSTALSDIYTDRSDASGTGYFNSVTNTYNKEIFGAALLSDREISLPRIASPGAIAARSKDGIALGAGCGDNAGAALGVNARESEMIISLGTSGTAFLSSKVSTHDNSGEVAGFADAMGGFLPLACTLNAARIFDTIARTLGLTLDQLSEAALSAPIGSQGLRIIPYFEGERTPNLPNATGSLLGITNSNLTTPNIARASIEGVLSGLRYASDAIAKLGVPVSKNFIIGGAARNIAIQRIATTIFTEPIYIPSPGEYVALGAARQAAWALSGAVEIPQWQSAPAEFITPLSSESNWLYGSYAEEFLQIPNRGN